MELKERSASGRNEADKQRRTSVGSARNSSHNLDEALAFATEIRGVDSNIRRICGSCNSRHSQNVTVSIHHARPTVVTVTTDKPP